MSIETIKMAKLADYWNHVANRKKFNIKICSLSIKNVPLFEDADITINSALTSICGRNGIGKTSLLNLSMVYCRKIYVMLGFLALLILIISPLI